MGRLVTVNVKKAFNEKWFWDMDNRKASSFIKTNMTKNR